MNKTSKRILFWTPRIFCILFAVFISLFALDAFTADGNMWMNLIAFLIHLVPGFILIAMLLLAWRWEWIGAAGTALFGLWLVQVNTARHNPVAAAILGIPLFLTAVLFLVNWFKRAELHNRH